MRVLSLFDGMACGMLAMMAAGVEVESYDAYEIDKYAIKTAQHNFPMIEQHGDVFKEDFTKYDGVDFLVGGSPCTYWSIAQTKNRETVASGLGWELFSQYVRALREAKPKYFIYENNKSMSKEIRGSIDEAFGFEAVCINSALVSAQNRQRLYWVGRRNEDGTYSKVAVEQPEDRGILLKDVLDGAVAWRDKSYTIDANYNKTAGLYNPQKQHSYSRHMAAEPVAGMYALPVDEPMRVREATKAGEAQIEMGACVDMTQPNSKTRRGRSMDEKSNCLVTSPQYYQYCAKLCYAVPHGAARRGEHERNQCWEIRADDKSNAVITGHQSRLVAEPICLNSKSGRGGVDGLQPSLQDRIYDICLVTSPQYCQYCAKLCYAVPCEWDENGEPTKAVSCSDGKVYPVYKVENGQITIKDKQYPIKLVDGYYIIRKLTVSECMRLQTVPEWYDFSCVSNSQAYKMLGNGWTVEVIAHLIRSVLGDDVQMKLF